jgi:hypothetical protein
MADLTKLSDKELAALEADLAKQRTELRLEQNAVENEKQFRTALKGMSPDQQKALKVRLEGGLVSSGTAAAEKKS